MEKVFHLRKVTIGDYDKIYELWTSDEFSTDIICSAIYHHDDKHMVDSPMDELLKDADVIHHTLNDSSKAVKEKEQDRYEALCKELELN